MSELILDGYAHRAFDEIVPAGGDMQGAVLYGPRDAGIVKPTDAVTQDAAAPVTKRRRT
jgi:hypothetical protein